MRICIKTNVNKPYKQIFSGFNEALFLALNPPIMPVKLLRFDGCKKGDEVHIQLPFKMLWISDITDFSETENEIYFIDEGRQLPFPLKQWKHKHRIIKQTENDTLIIDDINFSTNNKLLDFLIYPALWLQFAYRKPVYKKWFATITLF